MAPNSTSNKFISLNDQNEGNDKLCYIVERLMIDFATEVFG